MRKREIESGCKIIHDFMEPNKTDKKLFIPKGFKTFIPNYYNTWDNIIPVAKKCIDTYHDRREDIFEALRSCDKDDLFLAITVFIKWCKAHPDNVSGYAETKHLGKVEKLLWNN